MQRNSVTSPLVLLMTSTAGQEIGHSAKRGTSDPGDSRKNFFGGLLHKIFLLDKNLPPEFDLSRACRRIVRVIDRFQFLNLSFGDNSSITTLSGTKHRHSSQCGLVGALRGRENRTAPTSTMLLAFCNADAFDKVPNGFGRNSSSAQSRQSGHAGVVPSVDMSAPHQFSQHALGKHRVEVHRLRRTELVLMGFSTVNIQISDELPVVERTMILEFQRTD